jgi:hypothetical protein
VRDTLPQTEIRPLREEHNRKVIILQRGPTIQRKGPTDHQGDPTIHQKDLTIHQKGTTVRIGGIPNREMLMEIQKRVRKNAARGWGNALHRNGGAQAEIMTIAAGVITLKTEWISQRSEVKI